MRHQHAASLRRWQRTTGTWPSPACRSRSHFKEKLLLRFPSYLTLFIRAYACISFRPQSQKESRYLCAMQSMSRKPPVGRAVFHQEQGALPLLGTLLLLKAAAG